MYTWPESLLISTDWTDTPTQDIIENSPEVGLPIRRRRSFNEKHTIKVNLTLSYSEYHDVFLPFFAYISHGLDAFMFKSPVDSTFHETNLVQSNGQFYTINRQDNYQYRISLSLAYYTSILD